MKYLAIDTETTGIDLFHGCKPFAVSMCDDQGNTTFWEWAVDSFTREPKIPKSAIVTIRKAIHKIPKLIFHNAKFDIRALFLIGVDLTQEWDRVEDTILMSHAIDSQERHGLKELALQHLGIPDDDLVELRSEVVAARRYGKHRGWSLAKEVAGDYWMPKVVDSSSTHLQKYGIQDAVRTMRLFLLCKDVLGTKNLTEQYERERRLLPVVYQMEENGITLKPRLLRSELTRYEDIVTTARQGCEGIVAREATTTKVPFRLLENIDSPKQVANVLFNGKPFRLPVIKASAKSGEPSCDMEVLETLVEKYSASCFLADTRTMDSRCLENATSFLKNLLTYRKANTALKYLKGYSELALPEKDGTLKIHPSLNQIGTVTTRFSHSHPNTANIAKQAEMPLRAVFGPSRNHVWWCLDYNQLELRILAALSKDKKMMEAFVQGKDIHQWTADLCKIERGVAKGANFAIIYGMGPAKLAEKTGIKDMGTRFAIAYPTITNFTKRISTAGRRDGYITTVGGYRLMVPKDAPYVALNYLIQGSAGIILKEAMLNVHNEIERERIKPHCGMIMTIHDELVIEVEKTWEARTRLLKRLVKVMEKPGKLYGIHTPVDASVVCDGWSKPKPYKIP